MTKTNSTHHRQQKSATVSLDDGLEVLVRKIYRTLFADVNFLGKTATRSYQRLSALTEGQQQGQEYNIYRNALLVRIHSKLYGAILGTETPIGAILRPPLFELLRLLPSISLEALNHHGEERKQARPGCQASCGAYD